MGRGSPREQTGALLSAWTPSSPGVPLGRIFGMQSFGCVGVSRCWGGRWGELESLIALLS